MANASLERWKKRLLKVPVAVRKAASAQALKEATGLATAIQYAAEADEGALKESVRVETGGTGDRFYVKAGGEKTTRPVRAGASATYDYALANEFGNDRMPAQPFFFPPYRVRRAKIRKNIAEAAQAAAKAEFER